MGAEVRRHLLKSRRFISLEVNPVWIKIIILAFVALMLYSLFSGLFFLVKDRGHGSRTLKALTARISIWVLLFAFLCVGLYTGLIKPTNSVRPPWAQTAPE